MKATRTNGIYEILSNNTLNAIVMSVSAKPKPTPDTERS
jgi:hypothetical protein